MLTLLLLNLTAFIPRIAAAIHKDIRAPSTGVEIIYHWSDDNTEAIMALDGNGEVIGSAQGGTLNTGNFADNPISINFTSPPKPAGSIVVNGTTFPLSSSLAQDAITPDCGRISNSDMVEAHCTVPINSDTFIPQPLSADAIYIDLSRSAIMGQLNGGISNPPTDVNTTEANNNDVNSSNLIKRQCSTVLRSDKADKPKPQQWHLARQRSHNQVCGKRGCSAGVTDTDGKTFTYSATANVFSWLSGGFSVAMATTVGETHTCNGDAHDHFCIWYAQGYTRYKVGNYRSICCSTGCQTRFVDSGHIRSPNEHDAGSYYYCVYGKNFCRNIDAQYWHFLHKGGPGST